MQTTKRFAALMITMTMGASILAMPMGAQASEEGKRNTTIVLGVVAAGLLLTQKNKLPGVVAAAGAAYAYSQYDASIQARHQDEYGYGPNGYRYHDGHNADYRNHTDNRYGNNNDYHTDNRYGNSNDYHARYHGEGNEARNRYPDGAHMGSYSNTHSNNNATTYSNDGYRYGENGSSHNENYDGRSTKNGQDRTVRIARNTR